MSTLLSSDDIKLKLTNTAGPPDLVYGGDLDLDSAGVNGNHSSFVTCDTKNITLGSNIGLPPMTGLLNLLFTPAIPCPFTSATYTFVTGIGSMIPATHLKSEGHYCYLDGATGICAGGWTLTAPPNTPIVCNCTVELNDQDPPTNVKGV